MGFDNYSLYLTSVDKCLNAVLSQKLNRIKQIQELFRYETEQVNTIFSLIFHNKDILHPLGLEFEAIVNSIDMRIYSSLFKSRAYIGSLLNLMNQLGLLEFRIGNKSFDITAFGWEYWHETTGKKGKNNDITI
jgi:hypothetical protein